MRGECLIYRYFRTKKLVSDRLGGRFGGGAAGLPGHSAPPRGRVTVDDTAVFVGTLNGGTLATFEATRMAAGRKNAPPAGVANWRG